MTLENLCSRLEQVEKALADLRTLVKSSTLSVSWNESTTESGIQLQGSAVARRSGVVIDTQFMPVRENEMKLFYVVKKENGDVGLVPADQARSEP